MLSVLRLLDANTEHVADELERKVRQAPDFFRHMPVIIDLGALSARGKTPVFAELVEVLRQHGLVPVGVRNGSKAQHNAATEAGLALLRETQSQVKTTEVAEATTHPQPKQTGQIKKNAQKSRLLVRPIRSGQQVYVPDGDLVIVASAGAGSELLADGSIHVYGPLRGRALAGINGDKKARIFCQSLEAELVAVAGHYRTNEDLDPELKEKPAQIWLDDMRLVISAL